MPRPFFFPPISSGSTMANTAMLGSLLVPEMTRRGYSKKMSMGPILGTGGLAMIIPPSSLGVLLVPPSALLLVGAVVLTARGMSRVE